MNVSLRGLVLSWLLLLVLLHAAHGVEECLRRGGAGYHGSHRVSADGRPCLNWLEVQKSAVAPLPMVAEDHSFCRNPDGAPLPWCYVTSKHGVPEMHLCDIPSCQAPEVPSPSFSSGELQDVEGDKESAPEPADLMLTSEALDSPTPTTMPEESQGVEVEKTQLFDLTDLLPSRSESAAVQPVIGIRQRGRVNPKEKKDLGTLGYVLGVVMMVIIIAIGSGIVMGYIYKRGRDLKKQHEQTVYEREMQRITLPLSAFTNPTCEIVDENTIVVHASQTPVEESQQEGDVPLMAQAGTPGA